MWKLGCLLKKQLKKVEGKNFSKSEEYKV